MNKLKPHPPIPSIFKFTNTSPYTNWIAEREKMSDQEKMEECNAYIDHLKECDACMEGRGMFMEIACGNKKAVAKKLKDGSWLWEWNIDNKESDNEK